MLFTLLYQLDKGKKGFPSKTLLEDPKSEEYKVYFSGLFFVQLCCFVTRILKHVGYEKSVMEIVVLLLMRVSGQREAFCWSFFEGSLLCSDLIILVH